MLLLSLCSWSPHWLLGRPASSFGREDGRESDQHDTGVLGGLACLQEAWHCDQRWSSGGVWWDPTPDLDRCALRRRSSWCDLATLLGCFIGPWCISVFRCHCILAYILCSITFSYYLTSRACRSLLILYHRHDVGLWLMRPVIFTVMQLQIITAQVLMQQLTIITPGRWFFGEYK